MGVAEKADRLGDVPVSDITIEPGEMKLRLTLEQDVGTATDTAGQHVEDWQPWPAEETQTRWCAMTQLSAREIERAAMLYAEATHKIWMRYLPGLSPVKFRGMIGARVFNFGAVNNVDEANIKLEILACERIA